MSAVYDHNDPINWKNTILRICEKQCFLLDMDGVIYHGERLLPGMLEFLAWLVRHHKKFIFLTNGSRRTPKELKERLGKMGIDVLEDHFHTSAISSAMFLDAQHSHATAYIIGGNGLKEALENIGYKITETSPDYVVIGETTHYHFEQIEKAINFVYQGSKLIGTNCDVIDNADQGVTPACGSLIAPIEKATGTAAYFVGKLPNQFHIQVEFIIIITIDILYR
jgi:NagD protein